MATQAANSNEAKDERSTFFSAPRATEAESMRHSQAMADQ